VVVETLASLLGLAVTMGTPLLLAGLGELITQRSGVVNLGIEGIMAVGALVSVMVTLATGSLVVGFIAAVVAGVAISLIHGVLSISLKSDQVISGVMLTLLGTGSATFVGRMYFDGSPRVDTFSNVPIPVLSDVPLVGSAIFSNTAIDYLAFALVPAVWYFLYRSNLGLEIMSVGEDPATADSVGISVSARRYLAVLIGGAFAGAAGAHISLTVAGFWVAASSAGRGWIAFALVIFAQWRPLYILLGAYVFGFIEAMILDGIQEYLTVFADTAAWPVMRTLSDPNFMGMYPYLATIVILTVVGVRARAEESRTAPEALLEPYIREGD